MPQEITTGIKDLLAEAKAEITEVDVTAARELIDNDNALLIDIRDVRELWRDGKVYFTEDRPFIFMCAGGLRSALATQIAQRMGLKPAYNLIGGFGAWRDAEAPIIPHEKK